LIDGEAVDGYDMIWTEQNTDMKMGIITFAARLTVTMSFQKVHLPITK